MDNDVKRHFVDRYERGSRPTAAQLSAIIDAIVSSIRSTSITASRVGTSLVLEVARQREHRDHFLAKITGNTAITAGQRWKYAWTEWKMTGDTMKAKAGARSGTTSVDYALNLTEMGNSGNDAGGDGVNIGGADYPLGFDRRPIGSQGTSDTHGHDTTVVMWAVRNEQGNRKFVFSQVNAHDGTCAEGE